MRDALIVYVVEGTFEEECVIDISRDDEPPDVEKEGVMSFVSETVWVYVGVGDRVTLSRVCHRRGNAAGGGGKS